MKLSIEIIVRYLHEKFTFQEFGVSCDNLILDRPLFYNVKSLTPNPRIYIGYGKDFTKYEFPKDSLIISIGTPKEKKLCDLYKLLKFNTKTCPFELYNYINEIFNRFDNWDNNINMAINKSISLKKLLDYSLDIINNPIIIFKYDFTIISYSSIIDTNPKLRHLIDTERIYKTITASKNEIEYNCYSKPSNDIYIINTLNSGLRILCINIYDHNVFSYCIVLYESIHKHYPSDKYLFEYISKHIKYIIRNTNALSPDSAFSLKKILYHSLYEDDCYNNLICNELYKFKWFNSHLYCCLNIKVDHLEQNKLTVNSVCSKIEILINHSCSFLYNKSVVVFINLTKFNGDITDIEKILSPYLKSNLLKMGVSYSFKGFSQLKYYYIQSNIALDTGIRNDPSEYIYHFKNIKPIYAMESCMKYLPVSLLCSKKVMDLKYYDKIHNTEYYHTLKTYLYNNLSPIHSSKDLFIHKNTFMYRLEKIKELINIDFHNFDTIHSLYSSFKFLDNSIEEKLEDSNENKC